jgi:hypothetical protein
LGRKSRHSERSEEPPYFVFAFVVACFCSRRCPFLPLLLPALLFVIPQRSEGNPLFAFPKHRRNFNLPLRPQPNIQRLIKL